MLKNTIEAAFALDNDNLIKSLVSSEGNINLRVKYVINAINIPIPITNFNATNSSPGYNKAIATSNKGNFLIIDNNNGFHEETIFVIEGFNNISFVIYSLISGII